MAAEGVDNLCVLLPSQLEDIRTALQLRANYIETGNPVLSANDYRDRGKIPKELTEEQQTTVGRLRKLAEYLTAKE